MWEKRSADKFTNSGDRRLDEIKKLFTNLHKDLDYLKSEAKKRRTDRKARSWDELFDVVSDIDISRAQEVSDGTLRVEKPSGVSFIEKSTEETQKKHGPAAGVAFSSRFSEMYVGGTGLYQGAQLAKLHNGEEVTEGLALEQLPPLTFTQLKSEAKSIEWTSEARLKRERIMAMNLVLGIPVSQKEFDSSLRVIYTMESAKKGAEKKEKAVIKDVIAPAITTAFIDAGSSEITAGDKALIKKLSSGAKELIKKLDVDADRIKNWGLIPSDKVDLLMARITQLKKLVK